MNMENIEDVKQILERNNYQVTVFATDNGCVAAFPARVEPPSSGLTRIQYQYTTDGIRVIVSDESGTIHKDTTYPCPLYVQRLLMFSHVVLRCLQINYTVALIVFDVGGAKVDEDTFYEACINSYATEQDLSLEEKLKPIVVQCIFSSFSPEWEAVAKSHGIHEGFVAIRNLLVGNTQKQEEADVS